MATATKTQAPKLNDKPTGTIPAQWLGAFKLFEFSRNAMRPILWPFLGLGLLSMVVSALVETVDEDSFVYLIVSLLSLVISFFLSCAMSLMIIRSVRGKKLGFNESFEESLPYLAGYILVNLVRSFALFVSFLLLIVPFFFVLPRLLLAEYYVLDKKLDPIEAIKASWNDTRGHVGKVWGIFGVMLLMVLLCVTIIGIPVAIYLLIMFSAAPAILYAYIQKHPAAEPVAKPVSE